MRLGHLFAISFLVVSFSRAAEDQPVKETSDLLRVGSVGLTSEGNRLVLIGIDKGQAINPYRIENIDKMKSLGGPQSLDSARNPVIADFDVFGLKSAYSLKNVEPQYLIALNSEGPQQVWTFNQGSESYAEGGGENNYGGEWRQASVPTVKLIDVPHAHNALVFRFAAKMLLGIGRFTPLAPIFAFFDQAEKNLRYAKEYDAAKLRTILEYALDYNKYPALQDAMGRRNFEELGAAISVGYHRDSEYSGLLTPSIGGPNEDKMISLYETYRNKRHAIMDKQMANLVEVANQHGLIVIPYSEQFAMICYDKTNVEAKAHWDGKLLNMDAPSDLDKLDRSKIQDYTIDRNNLVPVGLYSLNETHAPLQMIDFHHPMKDASIAQTRRFEEFVVAMGTSVAAMTISIGVKVVEGSISFVLSKNGNTFFDNPIQSYGELAAVFETHVATIDTDGIMFSAIIQNLGAWGLNPREVEEYSRRLKSPDKKSVSATVQDLLARLGAKESTGAMMADPTSESYAENKAVQTIKLWNLLNTKEGAKRLKATDVDLNKRAEGQKKARLKYESQSKGVKTGQYFENLGPSQEFASATPEAKIGRKIASKVNNRGIRPMIVFMLDGMRPDRFHRAAQAGITPHLKELVIDNGVEFPNSFVSRSLTLPSWSTILTGFDIDEHGVKSNTPIRRDAKDFSESYLDWRKDLLSFANMNEGRSYKHIRESGIDWLPKYYTHGEKESHDNRDEVFMNYTPINDVFLDVVIGPLKNVLGRVGEVMYGATDPSDHLDQGSSQQTADTIRGRHKNPYKFVANWYSSIDEGQHMSSRDVDRTFRIVDQSMAKVIEAAKNDPFLKDATVVVVSDHGHIGGQYPAGTGTRLMSDEYFLDNTGLNLTNLFAGDYQGHPFNFVVGASEPPKPDYDLFFLHEFLIQPTKIVYHGNKNQNKGERSILVDYSGDNLAQVYLRPRAGWDDIDTHYSFYELQRFEHEGKTFNFPEELLKLSLNNLDNKSADLNEAIKKSSGMHPVKYFVMPLQGDAAKKSAEDFLCGATLECTSSREPVLVRSWDFAKKEFRSALVLTRRKSASVDEFSYVVVNDFDQGRDGRLSGKVSDDPEQDPFKYVGTVDSAENLRAWHSDKELLKLANRAKHAMPTAIFSVVRQGTLSPRIANLHNRIAEIPDFFMYPNEGFNFNSAFKTESDHGGLYREEVNNSFFIGGLGNSPFSPKNLKGHKVIDEEILGRDIGATILDLAGFEISGLVEGQSQRELLQDAIK